MNVLTDRDIIYSNGDGDGGKIALATAGIGAATAIGASLINKQRPLSEIEQKCGKRPLGRKKREAWQKCSDSFNKQSVPQTVEKKETKKPMNKNLKLGLIIGGSVLALGVITFIIYKIKSSKNK